MDGNSFTILRIDGSARYEGSVSRQLADELVERLQIEQPSVRLLHRDLSTGLPQVSADWVAANFTPPKQRTPQQRAELAMSDMLIEELQTADEIVMAVPMYNFSVPASVKAWIDLVCRAGMTFRYGANGPEGLLADRPVYLVMATGGVPLGSEVDFASGYLRQVWSFLGITDLRLIAADGLNRNSQAALARAREQISAALTSRAAA